jgi:sulfur carrier protein ThiS adenylyltransferase
MKDRYSRQILFHPIGEEGQTKLKQSHVLLIGAGALGTALAESLTRAGIGKITIVDRDYVEWSNLQRQQLYNENDAQDRIPKAIAAKKRLNAINSDVEVVSHIMDVTIEEMEDLLEGVDLILDATDNFDTRLLINDVSQRANIPWIYGACVGSYGVSLTIIPGETPCLQCLLDTIPLGGMTCDTAGIISPAVQIVVAHQVTEALKILTGNQEALRGSLYSFDLWLNQYSSISVDKLKKEDCLSCGVNPSYPSLDPTNSMKTAILCGRNTVQIRPSTQTTWNLEQLAISLKAHGEVKSNEYLLSLLADDHRLVFFADGRVLIHGTKDVHEAKRLYHQFVG